MVKNQHYIPRFYLKNFDASDSMLSVIRIENGKPGRVLGANQMVFASRSTCMR
ncbi:DUF4238 domain-containing protein [Collinsella sp. TM10-22]|uniref:DUF4238 domain-containing protein n=1 Tax=Collinsella sp. TM10-22 TaxID=2292344 RepID=UPI000E4EB1B3|nr:DUF4238 domain-containing protein [Collinsella sp. TM10-22]